MTAARLLGTTVGAPRLPPGSDAEVWVGDLDSLPKPSIIVRLLLTRHAGDGPARFFCVPGAKGLDLPTRFLEPGPERSDPAIGVGRLVAQLLGVREVGTHCVGFVRNVVRQPGTGYPHPVPWAHVPVIAVDRGLEPVVAGEWVEVESARDTLGARHWWPIVEHHLRTAATPGERP